MFVNTLYPLGITSLEGLVLTWRLKLILSAGINANQYGETADGYDLGQFYVCNQLYPLLRKTSKMPNTPAPRIVFESSEQHRMAPA